MPQFEQRELVGIMQTFEAVTSSLGTLDAYCLGVEEKDQKKT